MAPLVQFGLSHRYERSFGSEVISVLEKEKTMNTRKAFTHLFKLSGLLALLILLLGAMLLQLAGASPAAAEGGASEFNTQTTVSVSSLNLFPANPCNQGIQLTGDFVIQAHIVVPPSPVTPPSPIIPAGTSVTLHLDATRISGVGLTDGTLYQGSQGTSQNFESAPSTMVFSSAFDLVPSQPAQTPPSPVCPAQLSFQVQVYEVEPGVPAISASLNPPQ
jgi:hypothetical protein